MNESKTQTVVCLVSSREVLSGADRDRTDDPRLAKPVLSQLSYSPLFTTTQTLRGLRGGPS
jgi:hypothetical protein